MTTAELVAEARWWLATSAGRCPMTCPHGDRCSRERGHGDGCNHKVCPCNEPNVDRAATVADLCDRLEQAEAHRDDFIAEAERLRGIANQNCIDALKQEQRAEAAEREVERLRELIRANPNAYASDLLPIALAQPGDGA